MIGDDDPRQKTCTSIYSMIKQSFLNGDAIVANFRDLLGQGSLFLLYIRSNSGNL